jgi:hypothetical protein
MQWRRAALPATRQRRPRWPCGAYGSFVSRASSSLSAIRVRRPTTFLPIPLLPPVRSVLPSTMRSAALLGSLAALAAAQSSSDYSDFTPVLQLVSASSWQPVLRVPLRWEGG